MPSLFTRLYAQRPSPDRNQLENFLTEAFAFALERNIAFRDRWIKSLQWRDVPNNQIAVWKPKHPTRKSSRISNCANHA